MKLRPGLAPLRPRLPLAVLLSLVLPAVGIPAAAPAQADAPAAAAPQAARDDYRAGLAAAQRGNYEEAARLLQRVPPGHPRYVQAMTTLAYPIYGQALNRPRDGLPFIERAYAAAPAQSEVARAYVRLHVLAGVWFNDQDLARERRRAVAPEHAFLVTKPRFEDSSRRVPRAQLEADLDKAEHYLANCFAFLETRPVDYRAALDAIRLSLDEQTSVHAFEIQMVKLLSLFVDGHARTGRDKSQFLPAGYAPYAARSVSNRVVLIQPGREPAFVDPEHPCVTAIDGKPIADWLKVAGYLVMKESPQWHQRGSLEMLAFVTYLRGELGLPHAPDITLSLESEDGRRRVQRKVPVQDRPPRRLEFPRGASRRIGDIGYLRLSQMTSSDRVLSEIDEWMAKFRDTRGLILDVRGNLGGTKSILHTVFPYFMKPGDPMRILEMTSYRVPRPLPQPNPAGFAGSSMSGQTVGSSHWKSDAERRQVAEFIRAWKPAWTPPAGKFSEWHALGLDAKDNPDAYYYDKPVIVLQDSATFSAGDIFVGAFEEHPNVTQMGTPTGGGNSQVDSYRLPNSGVTLVMGWSAKYRPNGQLYDGVGIPPDIHLPATARDLVGETDTVLDAALRRLQAR
ncbi:MAG: hypothetical protein RJA22_2788 [Verrucomicrobiota bacterium]